MDHYGRDNYDPDLTAGSDGAMLGTTVRNVAMLVAMCLAVAWALNEFTGFAGGTAAPASQTQAASDVPPDDVDPAAPGQRLAQGVDEVVIAPGPRGHYLVVAAVNGVDVQFLVDTGASTVTLTEDDARRVGLSPQTLDYSATYRTANGEIAAAPVTFREIRIQDLEIAGVSGTVTRAPLHISLLGMSFLSRLAGYEVRDDALVLRN